MANSDLPDMYVLDALASDLESLEDILRVLNSATELGWRSEWGREFHRSDVVQALARLVQGDLVRVYVPDAATRGLVTCPPRALPPGDFDEAWYGITERGRLVHANWEPLDPPSP
jgi:hypothetical protein